VNWIATSPKLLCPICQKTDWCRIGEKWIHCQRVPSPRPGKTQGWFHPLNGHAVTLPPRREPPPPPTIDAHSLARQWHVETPLSEFDRMGSLLGVSAASLLALRAGWSPQHRAWSFPMRNGAGAIVGIRLRTEDGRSKWSVRGGHEGIFLPRVEPKSEVWVVEGPTDCAALLTLGKFSIGRPSCSGSISHTAATLARMGIRRCVIVADNDEDHFRPNGDRWNPGIDGAKRLSDEIGVPCCIVVLPCKDAREALSLGMTSDLLDSLVSSVVWIQPRIL